jgi:hypothetical protein
VSDQHVTPMQLDADELFVTPEEFFRVLDLTRDETRAYLLKEPAALEIWGEVQAQLDAMREWTAGGATPTIEQRDAIWIGRFSDNELEPTDDPALADYCRRLHLLNHYWREWPPDDRGVSTLAFFREPSR